MPVVLSAKQIAVFLPNWVGDVVMATPALRALRAAYPNASITYLGRPAALATVDGTTWADDSLSVAAQGKGKLADFLHLAGRLRGRRYDLAVLLPNSFRTAAAARAGGVRNILGYDRDGRGLLLTHKRKAPRDETGRFAPIPQIDYYNALLGEIGVQVDSRRMELPVREEDEQAAEALWAEAGITGDRPVVMLNPGAAFGPSKMWRPDRYAALADVLIVGDGAQIILNAAPSERAIVAEVARDMDHAPAINFAERENSLGLLKGLLRRCDLLVTNDTGARHIAAAFGAGVVTLFGSTDPVWAQIDYEWERTVRIDLPCSPCQKKLCPQPAGPLYHKCMEDMTVEMVLGPTRELLAERLAAPPGGTA